MLDGADVVATHARSYDRGQQIEDPAHVAELVAQKRAGREHRTLDRLHHVVPHSRELLRLVAERGGNIGNITFNLSRLLEAHAAEDIDAAVAEAIARGTPHVGAVRQALDRARHDRGEPPPVGLRPALRVPAAAGPSRQTPPPTDPTDAAPAPPLRTRCRPRGRRATMSSRCTGSRRCRR